MIKCFLPCRKGSVRVPNKNTRSFGPEEDGLIALKLKQLIASTRIDVIVVSSNDEQVLNVAEGFSKVDSRVKLDIRPEQFCQNDTSTDQVIEYVSKKIITSEDDHILWTHVTSPFFDHSKYDGAIDEYLNSLKIGFDSLLTVEPIYEFLWNEKNPINYDRSLEKWPRTQTLNPLYKVNSAIFLASASVYLNLKDRIGLKPYLLKCDKITGFDIDWEEDFIMGEQLFITRGPCV